MFLKKPRASTDPCLRSLLQKATRRGATCVVESAARHITALGDRAWLRSRTVVITFEECWPLAGSLHLVRGEKSKIDWLCRVAQAAKQKDAAGLGALAFALHEGDEAALDIVLSKHSVRIVSEGLRRPAAFFDWALAQCSSAASQRVVSVAREYLSAATWGWDKATILAGAFLAATGGVPNLPSSAAALSAFPYWVALDKHTPEGKTALKRIGARYGHPYRHLIWAGFYCESTVVNALEPSPWFEAERTWRLRKAGLDFQSAVTLWERVRPLLEAELIASADALRARVELPESGQGTFLSN